MSRTIQQQLSLILKQQAAGEASPREKSELRKMADRAGFSPSFKTSSEELGAAFTGKLTQWFQSETQRNISRAQGLSELLERLGR